MNPAILNKCIAELGKDEPDLSYIRGMLETLVELSGNVAAPISTTHVTTRPLEVRVDEEPVPEFLSAGPIGRIG